jgi:4-amino-4-deoxy-L-arabinose transferase-like glycosyltransferase
MNFQENIFDATRAPTFKLSHLVATCLFCLAWILPGLVGHEPWKPDEAGSFGLVLHIFNTGDWVVPTLAGEPSMDKPPLFYLSAALFAWVFSPLLPLHDAARLASGFYMGLTLVVMGLCGRALYGRGHGAMTVLILMGSVGLLVRSHQLISDLGLLTGFALCLYGLALNQNRPLLAGLLTGTGIGIGFMCRGTLAPIVMAFTCLLLPALFKPWRNRKYASCLLLALVAAAPWLIIWPVALYQRSPELFAQWLWVQDLGRLLGFAPAGNASSAPYFLKTIPWFAWPALPLALWTLWQGGRKGLAKPEIQLPLILFAVLFAVLSLDIDTHDLDALPFLLPLALLATPALETLRRGAASALDWFGIMTFGLLAGGLWLGWFCLMTGYPSGLAAWLNDYLPGYSLPFNMFLFLVAVAFTGGWFALISRIGRSNRRAIINWAGGMTMVWVLAMTLWLPWVDVSKNYRWVITSLQQSLPSQYQCISSRGLGETQRAMLEYYAGIITQRSDISGTVDCDLLLLQSRAQDQPSVGGGWGKIWEGGRPGDRNERYYLYQRPVAAQ